MPSESKPAPNLKSSAGQAIRILTFFQRYSSYAFSLFFTLHTISVAVLPAISYNLANRFLLLTKNFYQNPKVEPIIIVGALVVHIFSGISIRLLKLYNSKRIYNKWISPISKANAIVWTGYIALPLVGGHYLVTRYLPKTVLGNDEPIDLGFIAHSLSDHPEKSIPGMYLMFLLISFHSSLGWKKWLVSTSKPRLLVGDKILLATTATTLAISFYVIKNHGPATGLLAEKYERVQAAVPF